MPSTVPSTKGGTWSYGSENYGSKDQFPKIFSDFRQECQSQMFPGVRGENLKLNQPVICDIQTQIHSLHFYTELIFRCSPIFLSKHSYCSLTFIFPTSDRDRATINILLFFLYT